MVPCTVDAPCQPPLPCRDPCAPCCVVPFVGATGPAGPQGPQAVLAPAVDLTAILSNSYTLLNNSTVVVPYNYVANGNAAGRAAFDVNTSTFTVPAGGLYRVDFGVTFQGGVGARPLSFLALSIVCNTQTLSTATYTYQDTATASFQSTLNSFYVGAFQQGDRITVTVQNSGVAASALVGTTVPNFAPFATVLVVSSLF